MRENNSDIIQKHDAGIPDRIGSVLYKKGIIDEKTLSAAIALKQKEHERTRRNLAQILVQEFGFDHDVIFREVSQLYAFKSFRFKDEELAPEKLNPIRKIVNSFGDEIKKIMLHHKIIPLGYDELIRDKIILGAVDPTDRDIPQIIYKLNYDKFEVTYFPLADYTKLIEIVFPPENEYLKNLENIEEEFIEDPDEFSLDETLVEAEINKSALINLFEGALVEGVRKGASDVHIIPINGRCSHIYFRIDGKLSLWHKQENTLAEAMIAVVKDRSKGLDRFEREKAQDGYMQRNIDDQLIRFRVSILPVVGTEVKNKFESVVIRILDDRKVITDLDQLGLTGYARQAFEKSIKRPQGMIILTGPTGCGKSTTLVAALHQVINPSVNVLTVEDPVEYAIAGARQLKIGHKMNFDQAIRSILRHDPDIVLVGEIRDRETADIAIKLANTGHLTFTTLHTNDAPSAISRLYKMGIEPFLLAYAINIIVAQRLIRVLCECKRKKENISAKFFKNLGLNPDEWMKYGIYEAAGCDKCHMSGFKGRMAVHEALYFTREISHQIFNSGIEIDEDKIRQIAKEQGTLTLRESGFEKVKLGLTSFEEVISNTMES
ncbi:MAG: GspE/PulE family protein [Bacillota bacterium]